VMMRMMHLWLRPLDLVYAWFLLILRQFIFLFVDNLLNIITLGYFVTLFTLVLLRHLRGVIVVWHFLLLCFTLCPFVTKRGSNFLFGLGLYF
jgi:hypothetical protein